MLVCRRQERDIPWGLINLDQATKEDVKMFAGWVNDVLLRRLMERSSGQSSTDKDAPIDPQYICQCEL